MYYNVNMRLELYSLTSNFEKVTSTLRITSTNFGANVRNTRGAGGWRIPGSTVTNLGGLAASPTGLAASTTGLATPRLQQAKIAFVDADSIVS